MARTPKTTSRAATRSVAERRTAPSTRAGKPSGLTKKPIENAGADRRPLNQQYLFTGPQNPAGVSSIIRYADTGYMWRLCDLFEKYRNEDSHLQTVCSRRERALADVPWQIVPASNKRRDLKIAAWLEEKLHEMGDHKVDGVTTKSFSDTVTHLNAGVIYGYSAGEVPWVKEGQCVKPAGFLPMGARRFVYSQFDGQLRWFDVMGAVEPYPGVDLLNAYPDGRFLVHQPRINGAIGSREGLIRCLVWAAMFRLWTVKDWHRAGEFSWKPYRIGYYKKDGSIDEDRTAMEEALQYLSNMGFAALPDTVELEIAFAKNRTAGDGGVHGGLAAFLAAEMSKVTLGATLSVEQGKVGSNALGNVHQDVAKEVRDADARAIEGTIQRQLIVPMVRYNFGDVPMPSFRFVTEEGADLSLLAIAIEKLSKQGLQIPAKWVRTAFGIPEPDVGEELLSGSIRRDPAEVAAEAEKARKDAENNGQTPNAPADAPAKPTSKPADDSEEEPANDNARSLRVREASLKRVAKTYVVEQIMGYARAYKLNLGQQRAA